MNFKQIMNQLQDIGWLLSEIEEEAQRLGEIENRTSEETAQYKMLIHLMGFYKPEVKAMMKVMEEQ